MSRMLLSRTFNLGISDIPRLSREQFTHMFIHALQDCSTCRLIDNPDRVVEVLFDTDQITPAQLGNRYIQALAHSRQTDLDDTIQPPEYFALGGLNTTPVTTRSANSLQPNEWGVDIVKTENADRFLEGLRWDAMVADRPTENIFKSVLKP